MPVPQNVLDKIKDKVALAALRTHNEKDGWPLAPNTLARLAERGYITFDEKITDKGNELLNET